MRRRPIGRRRTGQRCPNDHRARYQARELRSGDAQEKGRQPYQQGQQAGRGRARQPEHAEHGAPQPQPDQQPGTGRIVRAQEPMGRIGDGLEEQPEKTCRPDPWILDGHDEKPKAGEIGDRVE